MRCDRLRRAATLAATSALAAITLSAADHRDGPVIVGTPPAQDINDVYVFPAQAPGAVVMVMTTNPMAGVMGPETFLWNTKYELLVDTTGDDTAELTFRITFSQQSRTGEQGLTVTGANGAVRARGLVGQPIPMAGGGRIMAGVFDDPFFFDRIAFQQSMSFCGNRGGVDFFRGLNVNAIVLEVPRSMLGSPRIGVWSRLVGSGGQIDRMAQPSVNAVLIPLARRDEYNRGEPGGDSVFRSDVVSSLVALGNGETVAGSIADALLPDVLRFDAGIPDGFPNGRRLADDVIDFALAQWTNGRVTTDCVVSESAFSTAFPYLAPANP